MTEKGLITNPEVRRDEIWARLGEMSRPRNPKHFAEI